MIYHFLTWITEYNRASSVINMSFLKKKQTPLESQLIKDTTALALLEGRRVGQPGHIDAKNYLIKRMSEIGLTPFSVSYTHLTLPTIYSV